MGLYYLCLLVHYQGDDPIPMSQRISRFISHNREVSAGLLVMMIMCVLVVTIQPVRSAKFVLAAWDYPDDYGQGIEAARVYQNVSGSWVSLTPFDLTSGDSTALEINETATGVKILVKCWLNNTVVGAIDFEDGKNYLRHNVNLVLLGDTVFSLQNFTYTAGTDALDPMFYYQYEGIIPFSPVGGAIYMAVVTYEIYY